MFQTGQVADPLKASFQTSPQSCKRQHGAFGDGGTWVQVECIANRTRKHSIRNGYTRRFCYLRTRNPRTHRLTEFVRQQRFG